MYTRKGEPLYQSGLAFGLCEGRKLGSRSFRQRVKPLKKESTVSKQIQASPPTLLVLSLVAAIGEHREARWRNDKKNIKQNRNRHG